MNDFLQVIFGGEYSVVVGVPEAVAVAMPALGTMDKGAESAVRNESGVAIRVSMQSNLDTMSTVIVFDILIGCEVVNPEAILRLTK